MTSTLSQATRKQAQLAEPTSIEDPIALFHETSDSNSCSQQSNPVKTTRKRTDGRPIAPIKLKLRRRVLPSDSSSVTLIADSESIQLNSAILADAPAAATAVSGPKSNEPEPTESQATQAHLDVEPLFNLQLLAAICYAATPMPVKKKAAQSSTESSAVAQPPADPLLVNQPAAEPLVATQSSVEQLVVLEQSIEQLNANQAPVEPLAVNQAPVEQLNVDQASVELLNVNLAPVDELNVDQATQDVNQAPVELLNVNQSVEPLAVDQPTIEPKTPAPLRRGSREHRRHTPYSPPADTPSQRQGISRYAPYGSRFAARMRDGSYKQSHISGDLVDRVKQRDGKSPRGDLDLVTHQSETTQLEETWKFCEVSVAQGKARPGPSEVLNFLRESDIDFDYRKGTGVRLLQRNASNFYKRMMEYGKRISAKRNSSEYALLHLDLSAFFAEIGLPATTLSVPTTIEVQAQDVEMEILQPAVIAKAIIVSNDDDDFEMSEIIEEEEDALNDQTFAPFNKRNRNGARVAKKNSRQLKIGTGIKGLSRHAPYGTRFSALMDDGSFKESFLAGELNDRVRVGKSRGEIILVEHLGERAQLEAAWNFMQIPNSNPGAAAVLDHLRGIKLDRNHRSNNGGKLLQKNAGNFYKRVQDFGKKRA